MANQRMFKKQNYIHFDQNQVDYPCCH